MTAREAFNIALLDLLDDDRTPACADDGRFTSEDAAERAEALPWCQRCPLMALCGDVATEEKHKFGVWAGIDRTPADKPHRSRKGTAA